MTTELTLSNFSKETGLRFRISKNQAARVALTKLDDNGRQEVAGMNVEAAATLFKARNKKNVPFNWVQVAINFASKWDNTMELTREGAFREFISKGGVARLQKRPSEIPNSLYADPSLTIANFANKVKDAIGVSRRFRMSREQNVRFKAGELTREAALAEVVASKQQPPVPVAVAANEN